MVILKIILFIPFGILVGVAIVRSVPINLGYEEWRVTSEAEDKQRKNDK